MSTTPLRISAVFADESGWRFGAVPTVTAFIRPRRLSCSTAKTVGNGLRLFVSVFRGVTFVILTFYDMNQHLGFAASTVDGENWHGPEMLEGTYGHYVWRAATFGGKAYLCGRRKKHFAETATRAERDPLVESVLLESDDGIVWKRCGVFQETYGDETAFLFEPDGSILAVARSGGGRNAQICRAKPPYSEFSRVDLDRYIGGPLLTKWGSRYVVGGRKTLGGPARCSLYWLTGGQLHEFAELPSGGDTSYPGFLETGPDRALLSWYSSHEKNADGQTMTAIYLADLTIAPPASDD